MLWVQNAGAAEEIAKLEQRQQKIEAQIDRVTLVINIQVTVFANKKRLPSKTGALLL